MRYVSLLLAFSFLLITTACGAEQKAPPRDRGEGPYERLILRGGILINGEGAPPIGPVDIVIENDRIKAVKVVGYPGVPIMEGRRPIASPGDQELDITGHYILPGFIDVHAHLGGSAKDIPPEYVLKLWLAHGVTTVREPGSFRGLEWTLDHAARAERNEIVAPRIIPYATFGMGSNDPITTAEQARSWVRGIHQRGAHGIKFFGATPQVIAAALSEAKQLGLGTMMHHAQLNVVRTNALDSARMGLGSLEHWYGLPEALFTNQVIQDYSPDYNYQNEQDRFGEAGQLWKQAAAPGSERWNAVRDELIALDFTLNPTFTIYEASRDLAAQRNAVWHQNYTLPVLWQFFTPSRYAHGSYWFDWTTDHEVAWRENYRLWMQFVNDYKNHGGRVTTGSDSGYIYKTYGFGYIQELELLREAGFNALEVIRSATLSGAELLGLDNEIGSVMPGKKADLVIVKENPLRNFKVLYGTGHYQLNEQNQPERTEGIRYTVRNGVVYKVADLLADVRAIVAEAKTAAEEN
ncbi:amidohydrolase family protein [Aliidiomarina quisquiliarum]|uniref:amidohydrolase family protein n=1 Tax=Aliidiomarina quisquiliarum TaxID=2938947 RepID=UPI00208FB74C|nr:amidohydrolase family protein [Aliidiomarina quisquiliarum]